MGRRLGALVGVALLVLGAPGLLGGCSGGDDDEPAEDTEPSPEAVAQAEAEARATLTLPVPPIEAAPDTGACQLFEVFAGRAKVVSALGSEIDDADEEPWVASGESWTARCTFTGAGDAETESASASLTLSTGAVPQGPDEIATLPDGRLDAIESIVSWTHEGLGLSVQVTRLPRDDVSVVADNDAALVLAEEIAGHLPA